MGGKSKSTTVGYHYRPAFHVGLVGRPIDAFLEYRAADKTAWAGELTASGRIQIDAPDLFGGEKDQGGIVGPVDVMFGDPDQVPNPYLVAEFGPQTVAWRGMTTFAFCGGRFGAMNPYQQKSAYKIRKIKAGWSGEWGSDPCWYPETAQIGLIPTQPLAIYLAVDLSGSMNEPTPNGRSRFQNMQTAVAEALDFIGDVVLARGGRADIMIVGFGTHPAVRESVLRRSIDAGGIQSLKTWLLSRSAGHLWTYFPAGLMDMDSFFRGAAPGSARIGFLITDGEPTTGQDHAIPPLEIAQAARALVDQTPGVALHGINIDLPDTTFTAIVDNTPFNGVPVLSGGDPSALTTVIMSALGGGFGINPAHLLLYVRTDPEKGGEPVSSINSDSLRAAADRLYSEGFGLCQVVYDPTTDTADSLTERVCRIIGGSFERSLVDGQWYLDLARGNYRIDELPVITDDDILEFRKQPTTLQGVTNSISVRYFDTVRKESVITPAARALGLIRVFGEIHETLDFPEIPTADLAVRVAERELRARITPSAAFELVTRPRAALLGLRKSQYFRLNTPKRGIAEMVCIVAERDTGTLRSGAVRWKVAQDIYGYSEATYIEVEPGVDVRPPQAPVPIEVARAFEAPYIDVAASLPRAELEALPDDAGYLLGVAARPSSGIDFTMAVRSGDGEFELVANGEWCPTATTAVAIPAGTDPVAVPLGSVRGLDQVAIGSAVLIGHEIFRLEAKQLDPPLVVVARGCADTVPWEHAPGERIWFIGDDVAVDATEYSDGETVEVKFLTNTGSRQLPIAAATSFPLMIEGRQAKPYPPADVRINGIAYPDRDEPLSGTVETTWSHRDRVLQSDQLVDASAGDVGPEPGTTYTVEYYHSDGAAPIDVEENIEGNASTPWVAPGEGRYRIEVFSVRDGLSSWQRQVRHVLVGAELWTPANLMVPAKLWLDWGSDIEDIGGRAAAWSDRSENHWDFEQPTSAARRPQIVANGLNGKRILSFDGIDDALTHFGAGADVFRNTGAGWALTAYLKRSSLTPSSSACVFYTNATSGDSNRFNVISSRGSTPGFGAFATRRLVDNTAIIGRSASDVGEWVMRLDVADWAAGAAHLWVNGELDGSNIATMTSGMTSDVSGPGLYLGAGGHAGVYTNTFSDIDLACVVVGAGSLPSRSEIDRLFGWVAWELGLQEKLPGDHPYRHARPFVQAPDLQPEFTQSPVVIGFVAEDSASGLGVAAGPGAAVEFGTLMAPAPNLSADEAISIVGSDTHITVRIDGLVLPVTPAVAAVLDHKGGVVAEIPLADGGGHFEGAGPGELEAGAAYYVRIEQM